ncbi:hypothetical protein [Salegentibacter sp. Hel_I_6]|uniref:hypothetical protein n=1 Tax=Salegentibacter sp. Hel_I_6 TaxID=1250278 RepID=UPI00055D653F|nr:hypothetical protein [Salegentibacter sp. Hel_I_6]
MQRFKVHIAIFLLAGFLFPQGASGMHYFLVEHFPSNSNDFSYNKSTNYDYHSCTYHLNGFSPLLLKRNNFKQLPQQIEPTEKLKFCCLGHYVHQPDFNFQLRGPPATLSFKY